MAGVACTHPAGQGLAAYCGVLGDMRSIAPSGVFPFQARTSRSACLDSPERFRGRRVRRRARAEQGRHLARRES